MTYYIVYYIDYADSSGYDIDGEYDRIDIVSVHHSEIDARIEQKWLQSLPCNEIWYKIKEIEIPL